MSLSQQLRRSLSRARRGLCEKMGIARYSYLALNGLDRKLERYLDIDGGVFVEAGANDGIQQSNTYYFERMRGWTGLLVEPVPELAAACRRHRRAQVAEAALVGKDFPGATAELHFAGLMSTLSGALGDAATTARHVATGLSVQNLQASRRLTVPARTLSALLDEAGINRPIDLLCLDVEGGEPEALQGLDLTRHAPRYICVEARDPAAISAILRPRYRVVAPLTDLGTHRDMLYALC